MHRENHKYKKWPDVKKAAAELGCTYGHLRLVLNGERISYKLLNDYLKLTDQWLDLPLAPLSQPHKNKKSQK